MKKNSNDRFGLKCLLLVTGGEASLIATIMDISKKMQPIAMESEKNTTFAY